MANYQLLKADIDEKVYQNGHQEITGENLNYVLNQMVTTLGTGYQFAGVATKDTNPGTPDAKVFYIANGKGTYTNFGGLEVTEDDVVVLYWDSSWHKVSTGIASQEKLSELESALSIYAEKEELTPEDKYGYVWGGVLSDINNTDFRQKIFAVNKDDLLTITATITQIDPNIPSIAFVENYVAGASAIILRDSTTGNANINYRPERNGYIIIFQSTSTIIGASNIQVVKRSSNFVDFQKQVEEIRKKTGYSVTESVTIASGGTYTPNSIELIKGNRYKITLLEKTISEAIFYTTTINDNVSYVAVSEGTSFMVEVIDGMTYWAWNNQYSAPATISFSIEKLPIYKEVSTYDIILPTKCKIASGRQLTIYAQNILDGTNPQNCQMMEYAWYNKHKDFVDFTPNDDNGSYSDGIVKIYLDDYITPTFEKPMAYDVIPSGAGTGKTKKCLFIGDSFTDMAQYIDELVTLFNNDGMNIELLGTRGTEGRKHEGRSGWNATDYCTKKEYLGMENPFFHNNAFDFSHYMQNNGYSGVDYVFICLGANDNKETLELNLMYYNQIINSIKKYESNIKIGIWTPCGGYQTYEGNMEQIVGIKIVDKFLIKNFDNRENENIYIIPTHMIVHPLYDYPYVEEGISVRNSNFKQLKITDCVHPSRAGMNKIADMIYSYIKYFGSLAA